MKPPFKLIAIALLLCCTRSLHAQQPDYYYRHLDLSQGLSHNQVTSIKDPASQGDDYINKIVAGPFKKLWIQLRSGCNIYDPVTEKIERRADKILQQWGLPALKIRLNSSGMIRPMIIVCATTSS